MATSTCAVRVCGKIRPLLPSEGTVSAVTYTSNSFTLTSAYNTPTYGLDAVYDADAPFLAAEVDTLLSPAIAFSVVAATLFFYGPTGSGKSHSMKHLVPYTLQHVFKSIPHGSEVSLSMVEVYKEKVYDLLHDATEPKEIPVREDAFGITHVPATRSKVTCVSDAVSVWGVGSNRKHVAATGCNKTSSRGHVVLSIYLRQKALTSRIVFCDLAGIEDNRVTGNAGERMIESCAINKSLFALGKCIHALRATKPGFVPFRESKLTRILSESLGGRAKTLMVCTVAPAPKYASQNAWVLGYACKTMGILNQLEAPKPEIVEAPPKPQEKEKEKEKRVLVPKNEIVLNQPAKMAPKKEKVITEDTRKKIADLEAKVQRLERELKRRSPESEEEDNDSDEDYKEEEDEEAETEAEEGAVQSRRREKRVEDVEDDEDVDEWQAIRPKKPKRARRSNGSNSGSNTSTDSTASNTIAYVIVDIPSLIAFLKKASVKDLCKLKGIAKKRAERIQAHADKLQNVDDEAGLRGMFESFGILTGKSLDKFVSENIQLTITTTVTIVDAPVGVAVAV
jgi:hypothetical protein